ncbi:hypothetical protein [Streptacidiphilus rugosus]|uniref:hypothetical protein n=1 Tax=Streptacidiphilus rugosus TaxID=405783 RepID=UPI0012FA3297|nr:hypothetical protein [Streptacidiphilus rugosus]
MSPVNRDAGMRLARRDDPVVHICRHEFTGTTAHGHDPLVSLLLERAGFIPQHFFNAPSYRLPYDLGEATQERMATDAARMLRACHIDVRIAPDLDRDAPADQRATWAPCPVHPDLPRPTA